MNRDDEQSDISYFFNSLQFLKHPKGMIEYVLVLDKNLIGFVSRSSKDENKYWWHVQTSLVPCKVSADNASLSNTLTEFKNYVAQQLCIRMTLDRGIDLYANVDAPTSPDCESLAKRLGKCSVFASGVSWAKQFFMRRNGYSTPKWARYKVQNRDLSMMYFETRPTYNNNTGFWECTEGRSKQIVLTSQVLFENRIIPLFNRED